MKQLAVNLIKLAAATEIPYQDVEDYLLGDENLGALSAGFRQSYSNDSLKTGDPIIDSFILSQYDKPFIFNPKAKAEDQVAILPADETGERKGKYVSKYNKDEYDELVANTDALSPKELRKAFAKYKETLQKQRKTEVLGASALAGGAGAIGTYVGSGFIPGFKKHKVLRALLALTAGAGVGYAYNYTADKNIYRNVDWEKLRDRINSNPLLLQKLTQGKKIDAVTPATSTSAEASKYADDVKNFVKRYGTDAAVGGATALGTHFATGYIPALKNKKLLRALIAVGTGVGAGALTDLIAKGGDKA